MFFENQDAEHLLDFIFPIGLNEDIVIDNCFELYSFLNICENEGCSGFSIYMVKLAAPNTFYFGIESNATSLTGFNGMLVTYY